MLLYTNGCSNTKGTHWSLKDHDRTLTWPNVLAKKLDAKLIDESKEGCSNFRLLKTTIDTINRMGKLPDLAVIQWTYNERFITPLGVYETNPMEPLGFRTHNPYAVSMGSKPTPYENFYFNFFNRRSPNQRSFLEEQAFFYMYLLQLFFESKNINYIFMTYETYENKNTEQTHLYMSYFDHGKWLHNVSTSIEEILDSFNYQRAKTEKPDGKIDNHYKEDAHEFISEAILDFYICGDKLRPRGQKISNRQKDIIHFYDEEM